jgi:RecF/RecN/SMC N terminal domain
MEQLDEQLLEAVLDRLAAEEIPAETADLVLSACAGDDGLRAVLAGGRPDLPELASSPGGDPQAAYLESVSAEGFRGIGPSAALRLRPAPGLTLVVGRNGSGKSSLAEAAEFGLTGTSPRWADQSIFRDGWRNLHHGQPAQIQLTLRADGQAAPIRIGRTWQGADTEPEQARLSVSAAGQRLPSVAELGWGTALANYRPFLTAGDFGRIISARPSTLFDALAPILGLDALTAADKRLMAARKEISDRVKLRKQERDRLGAVLAGVDDERARAAVAILARPRPDLAALDDLLARPAGPGSDPVAAAVRRLVDAVLPDPSRVADLAERLELATREAEAAATADTRTAQRLAGLLSAALEFHASQGDTPCPVCQTGTLDAPWREQAQHTLNGFRAQTEQAQTAAQRLATARADMQALRMGSRGPAMADANAASPVLGAPAEQLARALRDWNAVGQDPAAADLPGQLRSAFAALSQALAAAHEAGAAWLQQRHDAWREPAAALQTWLGDARRGAGDAETMARINAARDWLRTATEEIRAARLAPFKRLSQEIWQRLKQESNVELSGMALEGTGTSTRRRVTFPATVDGTAAQAMSVMSHGELQALGLAVFLPRACADASPFRFLLIDDPVHSMDPAKVDGLAQVLADLAATRQVIVFTHDNRLPDAIRRLEISATIWEVTRRPGSVVELRKNLDPVRRYLDDARAIACTRDLPDDIRWPVAAGFCRSAIEAACHDRIWREQLSRGASHAAVEARIGSARSLNETTALALFSDAHEAGKVVTYLGNHYGRWAADVFRQSQRTVHGGNGNSFMTMIDGTMRLTEALR